MWNGTCQELLTVSKWNWQKKHFLQTLCCWKLFKKKKKKTQHRCFHAARIKQYHFSSGNKILIEAYCNAAKTLQNLKQTKRNSKISLLFPNKESLSSGASSPGRTHLSTTALKAKKDLLSGDAGGAAKVHIYLLKTWKCSHIVLYVKRGSGGTRHPRNRK